MRELKSFLKNAAEKERTARAKLEKFIGELINRAEKAETELRSLKSHSSTSSGKDYLLADAVINQVICHCARSQIQFSLRPKTPKKCKKVEFVNSVVLDETTHSKPHSLDLHRFPSSP